MWFQTAAGVVYFLTHDNEFDRANRPLATPNAPPIRNMSPYDRGRIAFIAQGLDGEKQYIWYTTNRDIELEPKKNQEEYVKNYPKIVNAENLAEFFNSFTQKMSNIRLEPSTAISKAKETYTLVSDGSSLVTWNNNRMIWSAIGTLTQFQVEALQKYLGQTWKLLDVNGIIYLQNSQGEKIIPHHTAEILSNGDFPYIKQWREIELPHIRVYENLIKRVQKYVQSITPAKITQVGMSPKTHGITTRCAECLSAIGNHFEVHIARQEINPFLICLVYNWYDGKKATDLTWDLILTPSLLDSFKEKMEKFLINALRRQDWLPFMPIPVNKGGIAWSSPSSFGSLYIEGGQLARNPRPEPMAERNGNFLARELGRDQPRLLRPRRAFVMENNEEMANRVLFEPLEWDGDEDNG